MRKTKERDKNWKVVGCRQNWMTATAKDYAKKQYWMRRKPMTLI